MKSATRLLLKLLSVIALTPMLGSCEEHLPKYEVPAVDLEAELMVEQTLMLGELLGAPPIFGIDITNMSNDIDQFMIQPPYQVYVGITIALDRDPSRNIFLEKTVTFRQILEPRQRVRVELEYPLTDSQGYPWNWRHEDKPRHELIFRGKVRITKVGVEINLAQRQVIYVYPVLIDSR